MEDLLVYDHPPLKIVSHKGEYTAEFKTEPWDTIQNLSISKTHFIVDSLLYHELYHQKLRECIPTNKVFCIEASESNKALEKMPFYVEELINSNVKRGTKLIAIGGGIIQDICCFLSATLFRGLDWAFFPTTLLAQADSCIGSKSSINCGKIKNIIGTFTPPNEVYVCSQFLGTLSEVEIQSGIGEILKAHAIAGKSSFDDACNQYEKMFHDADLLQKFIKNSLEIKKRYIEQDEFDRGPRNIFNYGHTFGHAIEAATSFNIPHGVAVSMGMDLANFFAAKKDISSDAWFDKFHPTLEKNYKKFNKEKINFEIFLEAISKDKKNESKGNAKLILPDQEGKINPYQIPIDEKFKKICQSFFGEYVRYA